MVQRLIPPAQLKIGGKEEALQGMSAEGKGGPIGGRWNKIAVVVIVGFLVRNGIYGLHSFVTDYAVSCICVVGAVTINNLHFFFDRFMLKF